jgi:hypothetical protein
MAADHRLLAQAIELELSKMLGVEEDDPDIIDVEVLDVDSWELPPG